MLVQMHTFLPINCVYDIVGIYFEKVASFDKLTAESNRRYITNQLSKLKRESQFVTNSINSKLFEIIEVFI